MIENRQQLSDYRYSPKVPYTYSSVTGVTIFYFREDTSQQQVFCYYAGDFSEVKIYDGNWQIGDSIIINYTKGYALAPWH